LGVNNLRSQALMSLQVRMSRSSSDDNKLPFKLADPEDH
jgi:hypothetical protein